MSRELQLYRKKTLDAVMAILIAQRALLDDLPPDLTQTLSREIAVLEAILPVYRAMVGFLEACDLEASGECPTPSFKLSSHYLGSLGKTF